MTDKYNDYELLYLISEGSEEAEEILYDKYSFLIKKRIRAFKIQKRCVDDFYQVGLMCLNKAINTYCEYYNKSFNKYFDLILQRKYMNLLKKEQDYFYGVSLIEDYDFLSDSYIEDKDTYDYEEQRLTEYVDNLKNSSSDQRQIISELLEKSIKPRDIASLLKCDVKKVYNEIYAIKNYKKKRIDKKA